MTIDQNKELVQTFYHLLNAGQVEEMGDLVIAEYVEHDPLPGQGEGRDGVLDRLSILTSALAPRFTVDDVIAEGDKVVVRWTNEGTHVGEFAGIPATGRSFSVAGIDIYRVEGDRLAEHWHVIDQLALLGQLGVLPAMA
ncbi:MAG: ester cyclase [Aeromicrobium sp.]